MAAGLTMHTRRMAMVATAALFATHASVHVQAKAQPNEALLKEAITHYVATWNRHDVRAWSALLTDDIWYAEADVYHERMKGRDAVPAFFGDLVKATDLKWDVKRVKMMPDSTTTVVLSHFALMLPKTGEKYASMLENHPSLSQWRIEGNHWRMFDFASYKKYALVEMQKEGGS